VKSRLSVCVSVALALHASSLLFSSCQSFSLAGMAAVEPVPVLNAIAIDVAVEEAAAPGGGSETPDPNGPEKREIEQPVEPPKPAPAVPRAPVAKALPTLADSVVEEPAKEPDPPPDLMAVEETESELRARPAPARAVLLKDALPATAAAPDAATSQASVSRYAGSGPGAHGGPGGIGRGHGNGSGEGSPFGGAKGAFRAEISFIEPGISSLKEIGSWVTHGTFATDQLNVSPRKFNQGFPGISERTEWFAIRYRGKFKVAVADYYRFRLLSDDGAILRIDDVVVIDNDGQHAPLSRDATIPLSAGEHELYVEYYQGPRDNIALQLFVAPQNGTERLLGPEI
jgi:hypothetical protein